MILRVAIHILNESIEQLMGSIGIFEQSILPFKNHSNLIMMKHYWDLNHTTKFVIIPMRTNGLTAQRNPQPRKNKTQREAKHNKTKTNWKTNIRESLVIRSKIGDTGEIQCRRYDMYIERGAGELGPTYFGVSVWK